MSHFEGFSQEKLDSWLARVKVSYEEVADLEAVSVTIVRSSSKIDY